ncbi:hypothetical protein GSI_01602 [Ganoderma sinense ZZ0214-1]|uniref:Uncharacterized protein n=1 Tax=Ganoderma sinense ZZ0214-1 TaxID=1077348 RepID=A0A2G8SQC1_9APHY|nr:hypothetical protein GSI_01602 [Ganoderma sinense ZZ0214-1]
MADTFLQANGRLPAWSIYAQQLFHHRHGYSLWMPEYDPCLGEVKIGDVGWINEGGFYPLFNSLKSMEEPQPRGVVPEGHEPMNLANVIVSDDRKTITQPLLCGGSIKQVKASATLAANGFVGFPWPFSESVSANGFHSGLVAPCSPSAGAHFGFECSTDAGAFLLLAPPAVSKQIQSKKHIADYMRKNFPQWSELANSHFGLGLKDEEIVFVSGTTKTSKWAVAAFHGEYRRKEGSITADFGSLMGIEISVSISDEMLPSSYYRTGPAREPALSPLLPDTNEPVLSAPPQERCDQCIFLHYYKMKRRLGWKSTPMQAAGGPHELPPSSRDGGDDVLCPSYDDAEETPIFDEDLGKPFDPVNDILDYILEVRDTDTL